MRACFLPLVVDHITTDNSQQEAGVARVHTLSIRPEQYRNTGRKVASWESNGNKGAQAAYKSSSRDPQKYEIKQPLNKKMCLHVYIYKYIYIKIF